MSFKSILQSIGNAVSSFFTKDIPAVENALTSANGFLNIVKTFLGSATGETLQAILDALAPGVAPAVFTALNTFLTDFGLIISDVNKTAAQLSADGLNAISKLTGDSKTLALSNAASVIGNAMNGGAATLQQHIVANQLIYNPNVLDVATSPAPVQVADPNVQTA